MKQCPHCGREQSDNNIYCLYCGKSMIELRQPKQPEPSKEPVPPPEPPKEPASKEPDPPKQPTPPTQPGYTVQTNRKKSNSVPMLLVLVLVAAAAVVGGYLFLHGNSAKCGGESTGESQSFLAEESEAVETTATETDYETESQDVESSYETEAQTTEEQETQVAQEASEPAIERYFQGELVTTGDYILPDSDTRLYSVDELAGMTATQLRLARNEIYARHGRLFKDDELQAYFNACDWYSGTVSWDSFDDAVFSATEKANIVTIQEAEARLG